ncbi:hypothetical protein ACJX0J_031043, partial [Zea mays]
MYPPDSLKVASQEEIRLDSFLQSKCEYNHQKVKWIHWIALPVVVQFSTLVLLYLIFLVKFIR